MTFTAFTCLTLVAMAFPPFCDKDFRTETVVYAQPDANKLKGTLYLPLGETKGLRPAIVLIHGGAWATGSRRQLFWYGRRFAEHGYVALSVSYRTMPGAPFPAPVHDVKAAVRWLRAHAEELRIDPDRIAALGTSAGGHLALMLALTEGEEDLEGPDNPGLPSGVQAAVSLYGPADLQTFAQKKTTESALSKYMWEPYLKKFAGERELAGRSPLKAASPLSYVGPHSAPVLVIHGSKDRLVPIEQSRTIYKKLKEAGVPSESIEVPGQRHAFDHLHPSQRREIFPRILAFLEKHLDGRAREATSPAEGDDAASR